MAQTELGAIKVAAGKQNISPEEYWREYRLKKKQAGPAP